MFARATLVALALSTNGCASTFDASHLGVTATMAEPALPPVAGTTFKISRHPVYLIWGMFPMGGANLEDLLAGQLGMNASIAKLRIKVQSTPRDVFFTLITAGLVAPRTVTYEGVVVKPTTATPETPPQ
jgi:hypothetical protein